MNPKIITFYLPQFHRIPENDKWWGEGFTEWEAVKKAVPLFPGHYQPRVPDHEKYYNLLDKSVMEWQTELARKAGIYGFCIYHYWFGDKQLLEKPAENLLEWKDIPMRYCFSWANESWVASWSRLAGNAWTDGKMPEATITEGGFLQKQKYGKEEEWKKHFLYLLPFFLDERYIKKDGKPVFVIYKPGNIPQIKKWIHYWRELAEEYNLLGLYIVGTNCPKWKKYGLDAELLYEPDYTCFVEKEAQGFFTNLWNVIREELIRKNYLIPMFLNYDNIWRRILNRKDEQGVYPGGYVDFDASPRRGLKAKITWHASPHNFYRYFKRLYRKCRENGKEFIFLTAWNEWGEGAYLEPDKRYGKAYLNAIRKTIERNRTLHKTKTRNRGEKR